MNTIFYQLSMMETDDVFVVIAAYLKFARRQASVELRDDELSELQLASRK